MCLIDDASKVAVTDSGKANRVSGTTRDVGVTAMFFGGTIGKSIVTIKITDVGGTGIIIITIIISDTDNTSRASVTSNAGLILRKSTILSPRSRGQDGSKVASAVCVGITVTVCFCHCLLAAGTGLIFIGRARCSTIGWGRDNDDLSDSCSIFAGTTPSSPVVDTRGDSAVGTIEGVCGGQASALFVVSKTRSRRNGTISSQDFSCCTTITAAGTIEITPWTNGAITRKTTRACGDFTGSTTETF